MSGGDGWGTTHLPDGKDIHHYDKDKFGGKDKEGNGGSNGDPSRNNDTKTLNYTDTPGTPATVYAGGDTMSLQLGATLFALSQLQKEALIALLTNVTVIGGRVFGLLGLLYPSQIAPDPKVHIHVKDLDIDNPNVFVSLPAENMTRIPVKDIPKNTSVPADVIAQAVIDELAKTRPVALTPVTSTPVPVVKAQKTDKPNVYTAQVIPGMKPVRITVDNSRPVNPAPSKPGSLPAPKRYLPAPKEKDNISHHAVIDFGGDHAPLYVSVTKQVKPEEAKKQAEQAKKDWAALYPVEAAQEQLDAANKEFGEADKHYRSKLDVLNKLNNTPEGLTLSDPARHPLVYEQNAEQRKLTKQDISFNSRHLVDTLLNEGVKAVWREVMKEELKKPATVDTAKKAILLPAFYERLSIRLLDVHKKMGPAQKEVNVALESRKKAEGKKKAAEDKVREAKEKKRQGVKDKGHDYHPAPKTEEIKGLGELKEGKWKTPKQGGGGKRARWFGDKGRKIYEWDSQHGELEGYRASDGQHIGAFDPKTGNQLKPADPKRNIKKYL